jgi:hypothetical protein
MWAGAAHLALVDERHHGAGRPVDALDIGSDRRVAHRDVKAIEPVLGAEALEMGGKARRLEWPEPANEAAGRPAAISHAWPPSCWLRCSILNMVI